MTHPLPTVVRPPTLEDLELAADLRRDLGADTLFFICAIEAALGVHIDEADGDADIDAVMVGVPVDEKSEQLAAESFEEAA